MPPLDELELLEDELLEELELDEEELEELDEELLEELALVEEELELVDDELLEELELLDCVGVVVPPPQAQSASDMKTGALQRVRRVEASIIIAITTVIVVP